MDIRVRRIADYFLTCSDRSDVDPTDIAPALWPHIYVLRIEPDAPPGTPHLRVALTGTSLDATFGRSMTGRHLETFLHGPRGSEVIAGYLHCAQTGEPIWMRQVARLADRPGRYVEGVAVYLTPGYIYGGFVAGETANPREPAVLQTISLR